jgi:ATP-dependent helicase HrpA
VLRLLALKIPDKLGYLEKNHGLNRDAMMAWSAVGSAQNLVRDLIHSCLRKAAGEVSKIRSEEAFNALSDRVRKDLGRICASRAGLLNEILEAFTNIRIRIDRVEKRAPEACEDMRAQISDLIYEGFLDELEPVRLEHYPRYLAALSHRLEKLEADPLQDQGKLAAVAPWWRRYQDHIHGGGEYDHALDTFRWMIAEYRVSVFAQQLGTDGKVSEKRLRDAWDKVNRA